MSAAFKMRYGFMEPDKVREDIIERLRRAPPAIGLFVEERFEVLADANEFNKTCGPPLSCSDSTRGCSMIHLAPSVNQPTAAPTRKVTAGGFAGALTFLGILAYQHFTGKTVDGAESSAISTTLGFIVAWIVPSAAQ